MADTRNGAKKMNNNQTKMSNSVIEALILLDKMRVKAQKSSNSYYQVERIEQAMDYLLNNPKKQGEPKTIIRDVMGSAGSKIRDRINIIKKASELAGISSPMTIQQDVNDHISYFKLELIDEITHSLIKNQEKKLLIELASEKDAVDLSEKYNTSIKTMRTRISKARSTYKKEIGLAI